MAELRSVISGQQILYVNIYIYITVLNGKDRRINDAYNCMVDNFAGLVVFLQINDR